jgi:hypothetical protein
MLWPAPVVGDIMRYTISPVLGRVMAPGLFRTMFAPAPVSARFKYGFPVELTVRPWQIRAAAAEAGLMIPQAYRLARKSEALSLPVLIVTGLQDNVVDSGRQSRQLAEELPNSILTPIPGAGHMVHHTAPEQVANVIHELAQCSSPEAEREPSLLTPALCPRTCCAPCPPRRITGLAGFGPLYRLVASDGPRRVLPSVVERYRSDRPRRSCSQGHPARHRPVGRQGAPRASSTL